MQQNGRTTISGKIDSTIKCKTVHGFALEAPVSRLSRHMVMFEINDFNCVLGTSEVLSDFQIRLNDRILYSGRAVVANLINTGAGFICEATLDGIGLNAPTLDPNDKAVLKGSFNEFLTNWGKSYRIDSDLKVLVADMNSYLTDLRLWLEHVELIIGNAPAESRAGLELQALTELHQPLVFSMNALFEKFEVVTANVRAEDKPAHRTWVRRQLHPLILCSPFADRTYHKPLGYAGDYEMVNMILRSPFEGASLFAKALNGWFLSQPPAEAHRNRIKYLTNQLVNETARVSATGKKVKVFNLGCGPALEIQRFLAEHEISNRADFTLLDFNDETLAYTTDLLNQFKTRHNRSTDIKMVKKSVAQLLTGRDKTSLATSLGKYDFVYCAGLFDYLPDHHCRQLMNIFYEMLAPGGLLVSTNVDAVNPIQQMLDYILDWNLIYRNGNQLGKVSPTKADPDRTSVCADETSVNIYLEVRKPTA